MAKPKQNARGIGITIAVMLAIALFAGASLLPATGLIGALKSSGGPVATPLAAERLQPQIDGYRIVLGREPQNETALKGLADALLAAGSWEAAIAPMNTLFNLHPEQLLLGMQIAQLQEQSGHPEQAITVLQAMNKAHPQRTDIVTALADAELSAGQSDRALTLLQHQLESSPENLTVSLALARTYRQLDRPAEALTLYDDLADRYPDDYRPLVEKAIALSETADMSDNELPDTDANEANRADAGKLFIRAAQLAPKSVRPEIDRVAKHYRALS